MRICMRRLPSAASFLSFFAGRPGPGSLGHRAPGRLRAGRGPAWAPDSSSLPDLDVILGGSWVIRLGSDLRSQGFSYYSVGNADSTPCNQSADADRAHPQIEFLQPRLLEVHIAIENDAGALQYAAEESPANLQFHVQLCQFSWFRGRGLAR